MAKMYDRTGMQRQTTAKTAWRPILEADVAKQDALSDVAKAVTKAAARKRRQLAKSERDMAKARARGRAMAVDPNELSAAQRRALRWAGLSNE